MGLQSNHEQNNYSPQVLTAEQTQNNKHVNSSLWTTC